MDTSFKQDIMNFKLTQGSATTLYVCCLSPINLITIKIQLRRENANKKKKVVLTILQWKKRNPSVVQCGPAIAISTECVQLFLHEGWTSSCLLVSDINHACGILKDTWHQWDSWISMPWQRGYIVVCMSLNLEAVHWKRCFYNFNPFMESTPSAHAINM